MTPERLVLVTAMGKDTDVSNYSAIAELAAALAACRPSYTSGKAPDGLTTWKRCEYKPSSQS